MYSCVVCNKTLVDTTKIKLWINDNTTGAYVERSICLSCATQIANLIPSYSSYNSTGNLVYG